MALITKEVEITIIPRTQKYYESLGYNIPRELDNSGRYRMIRNTKITINVEDLPDSSKTFIFVACESCEKRKEIRYSDYKNSVIRNGEYYCYECYTNIFSSKKQQIAKMSLSFYDWCVNTGNEYFLRKWDYSLNEDNPKELSYLSAKKVYFLCDEFPNDHKSELVELSFIAKNQTKINCLMCNSLGYLHPESFTFWGSNNTLSPFDYKHRSNFSAWWKCLDGHDEYYRNINRSVSLKFRCPKCTTERDESFLQGKVRNYINEIGYSLLHERNCDLVCINENTGRQLPFDNQIIEIGIILEIHGKQHYHSGGWNERESKVNKKTPQENLEYVQWRDEYKKQYALSQGYAYLAIPYWEDDENETYKISINNAIYERIQYLNSL